MISDYNFKDTDFANMMFPVHTISERNFCLDDKGFRRLKDYNEFKDKIDGFTDIEKDQTIRYICYMYDINSPLLEINLLERKAYAVKLSGFSVNERKEVDPKIMFMIKGKNEQVNRMIIRFCMLFNSIKYTKLVGLSEAYENMMVSFLGGDYDSKQINAIDSLEKKMSTLVKEIFTADDTQELSRTIYLLIDEERLELTPELVALRIMEGKNSVDINPYKLRNYI